MSILKDTIYYINNHKDDLTLSLYKIEDDLINNKKYKKPLKIIFSYLSIFEYCNFIIPVARTIAENTNQAVPNDYFYRKNGNIPFPEYLTKTELKKMYINIDYIKTFERKCKLKEIKK